MAQNEMKACSGLPERVRSNEGLGVGDADLAKTLRMGCGSLANPLLGQHWERGPQSEALGLPATLHRVGEHVVVAERRLRNGAEFSLRSVDNTKLNCFSL